MSTNTVLVTPDMVEAAKLRVKLESKLGLKTSPVIAKIAAAERPAGDHAANETRDALAS